MPPFTLPEITLRSAAAVPPMVLSGLDTARPNDPFGLATLPEFPFRTFPHSEINTWYRDLLASWVYPGSCLATRDPHHKEAARAAYTHVPLAPTPVPIRLHRAKLQQLPVHRHRL